MRNEGSEICLHSSGERRHTLRTLSALVMAAGLSSLLAQDIAIVRPKEIDDVLVNPGIGFTTFQRFNGDELNQGAGWTEGYPIVYQEFKGSLENKNYPMTTIAYFRVYWKFIEPAKPAEYNWKLIDKALKTARDRGQSLMLRVAPYGTKDDNDVPAWYREIAGEVPGKKLAHAWWRVDPENAAYVQHFGSMIRALG